MLASRVSRSRISRPYTLATATESPITSCQRLYYSSFNNEVRPKSSKSSSNNKKRLKRIATVVLPVGIATGLIVNKQFGFSTSAAAKMSEKLVPQSPEDVMVIRDLTPNVVTLSVPFKRFGTIPVGGRGTIVKLTNGSLAIFSPVALTDAVKTKVSSMGGNVRYIIAPDTEHHIFVTEWALAYPNAKLIGPEGLPEKRLKQTSDPKVGEHPRDFAHIFKAENKLATRIDAEFDADFEYEYVDAHPNKEFAFLYKPDKILLVADLLWNLPPTEQYSRVPDHKGPNLISKAFYSAQGTSGEAKGQKRFLWYFASAKDRDGYNASSRRIASWDFNTVVPCHGDTMVGNGKEIFEKVFAWHLQGTKQ